ncbi:MAG: histidine phosphatase family protein [Chloroflexi bacterium]|nr:histidine phosphatase family protein [Chloroflexota bacterium]
MTLYLIRHGLAAAGLDDLDPGLAPLGHEQAAVTARALRKLTPSRLVVSPLRRTRETADPIAAAFGLEAEIREEVAEVFDPSLPPEERKAIIGPFMEGVWSEQNETLQAWRRRVVETLVDIGDGVGDVIVVSHYIAICVAIGEATRNDRVVPVKLGNTSITSIDVVGEKLLLVSAGSTEHLPDEQVTGVATALPGGP